MKKQITKELKSFYDFNQWEITKDMLLDLSERFSKLIDLKKYQKSKVEQFFLELSLGMIDNVYKSPISLLNAFYKWQEEKQEKCLDPKKYS